MNESIGPVAFAAQLSRQKPAGDRSLPRLEEWRILARAEVEVLFGHGLPPRIITVAMRRAGRHEAGARSR